MILVGVGVGVLVGVGVGESCGKNHTGLQDKMEEASV